MTGRLAGECYKTRKPPIAERLVSGLFVEVESGEKLQNKQNVTSTERSH